MSNSYHIVQSRKVSAKLCSFLLALAFYRVRGMSILLRMVGLSVASRDLYRIKDQSFFFKKDVSPFSWFHFTTHHVFLPWRDDFHTPVYVDFVLLSHEQSYFSHSYVALQLHRYFTHAV